MTIVAAGWVGLGGALVSGLAMLAAVAVDGQRAQTGADAAALAGAEALALGGTSAGACDAAREMATANAAVLLRCVAEGADTMVTVRVGRVSRSARAVVDPCVWCSAES